MTLLSNCLEGSAWETWQKAGMQYVDRRGPAADIEQGAQEYFEKSGFGGSNAENAIKTAFMEGARHVLMTIVEQAT